MATFSDSIEAAFLTTVYVRRRSDAQDASGNYDTTITTITSGLEGDIQPAKSSVFMALTQGSDYRVTHSGFFDVPATLPALNDEMIDGSLVYAVHAVRNFKDHLELDLERLGV